MKSLLQHPDAPANIDVDALEELTVFGYVFSGDLTPLSGICQVPPGTVVQFDKTETGFGVAPRADPTLERNLLANRLGLPGFGNG